MKHPSQSSQIKASINEYLNKGMKDKQEIFTKVVDDLGVPRPSVRRVAGELKVEMLKKVEVLESHLKLLVQ